MISIEDRISLSRLKRVLGVFRAVDQELPVGAILVFLMVALETDQTLMSIGGELGSSTTTPCRYLQRLGAVGRGTKPGLGLIATQTDSFNKRRKSRTLTYAGLVVISEVLEELNRLPRKMEC